MGAFGRFLAHPVAAPAAVLAVHFATMQLMLAATGDATISLIVMDAVAVALSVAVLKASSHDRPFGKCGPPGLGFSVGAVFLFVLVWFAGMLAATWVGMNLSDRGTVSYNETAVGMGAAYLVATVAIAPVTEELVYRGVVFGGLSRTPMPPVMAAIVASVVFASMHGTLAHAVPTFTFGMFCCMLYAVTGRIWVSMIAHCTYNVLSLATGVMPIAIPAFMASPAFIAVANVVALAAITALFAAAGMRDAGAPVSVLPPLLSEGEAAEDGAGGDALSPALPEAPSPGLLWDDGEAERDAEEETEEAW